MYYLQHEKTGKYVSAIIKLRGGDNAYAVYFGPNPSVPSWKTQSAAQKALDRLLDCEYTNPRGVALDLIVVNPEEKEEVAHMNEMMTAQERTPARSLVEIEADILAQKRTIGRSIVIIGQDLIEAKSKLEHGLWGTWLAERVNFSQSTAENYMKIAEQVDSDSALLNLPYTKVLALLAVPAEEREEFAAANNVEDKSVAQIKQLIREKEEAEKKIDDQQKIIEMYARDKISSAHREQKDADQIALLKSQLAAERAKEPDTVTVEKEVPPSDYEWLKNQVDDYKGMIEEADEELVQARVERDQAIKALEQAQERDPMDVKPFCDACSLFLNSVFMAPFSKEKFEEKTDAELDRISIGVHNVLEWAVKTQDAVDSIRDARSGFEKAFVLNF